MPPMGYCMQWRYDLQIEALFHYPITVLHHKFEVELETEKLKKQQSFHLNSQHLKWRSEFFKVKDLQESNWIINIERFLCKPYKKQDTIIANT